jgi:hypothetical protein
LIGINFVFSDISIPELIIFFCNKIFSHLSLVKSYPSANSNARFCDLSGIFMLTRYDFSFLRSSTICRINFPLYFESSKTYSTSNIIKIFTATLSLNFSQLHQIFSLNIFWKFSCRYRLWGSNNYTLSCTRMQGFPHHIDSILTYQTCTPCKWP